MFVGFDKSNPSTPSRPLQSVSPHCGHILTGSGCVFPCSVQIFALCAGLHTMSASHFPNRRRGKVSMAAVALIASLALNAALSAAAVDAVDACTRYTDCMDCSRVSAVRSDGVLGRRCRCVVYCVCRCLTCWCVGGCVDVLAVVCVCVCVCLGCVCLLCGMHCSVGGVKPRGRAQLETSTGRRRPDVEHLPGWGLVVVRLRVHRSVLPVHRLQRLHGCAECGCTPLLLMSVQASCPADRVSWLSDQCGFCQATGVCSVGTASGPSFDSCSTHWKWGSVRTNLQRASASVPIMTCLLACCSALWTNAPCTKIVPPAP